MGNSTLSQENKNKLSSQVLKVKLIQGPKSMLTIKCL
jgi:hypothetical protein